MLPKSHPILLSPVTRSRIPTNVPLNPQLPNEIHRLRTRLATLQEPHLHLPVLSIPFLHLPAPCPHHFLHHVPNEQAEEDEPVRCNEGDEDSFQKQLFRGGHGGGR